MGFELFMIEEQKRELTVEDAATCLNLIPRHDVTKSARQIKTNSR